MNYQAFKIRLLNFGEIVMMALAFALCVYLVSPLKTSDKVLTKAPPVAAATSSGDKGSPVTHHPRLEYQTKETDQQIVTLFLVWIVLLHMALLRARYFFKKPNFVQSGWKCLLGMMGCSSLVLFVFWNRHENTWKWLENIHTLQDLHKIGVDPDLTVQFILDVIDLISGVCVLLPCFVTERYRYPESRVFSQLLLYGLFTVLHFVGGMAATLMMAQFPAHILNCLTLSNYYGFLFYIVAAHLFMELQLVTGSEEPQVQVEPPPAPVENMDLFPIQRISVGGK